MNKHNFRLKLAGLVIVAFLCIFMWNSKAAPLLSYGYIPYESSPNTYSPTDIIYNVNGSYKTVGIFNGLHQFDTDGVAVLGLGSRHDINTENEMVRLGDVQNNFDGTEVIIKDGDQSITLKGQVFIPSIVNCAQLATDSSGKIICAP